MSPVGIRMEGWQIKGLYGQRSRREGLRDLGGRKSIGRGSGLNARDGNAVLPLKVLGGGSSLGRFTNRCFSVRSGRVEI
jgi:hypothetical protein